MGLCYVQNDVVPNHGLEGFLHSMEIEEFSVTQILREINFGEIRSSKTAIVAIPGALNSVDLVNFNLQKVQ